MKSEYNKLYIFWSCSLIPYWPLLFINTLVKSECGIFLFFLISVISLNQKNPLFKSIYLFSCWTFCFKKLCTHLRIRIWAATWQNQQSECAPSEYSDQRSHPPSLIRVLFVCLCWGLTSQSTIFHSCRDGATASWVINQYFRGVKCLAQGHNTAAVGIEPPTSRSGVRHSTTEPPRSPSNQSLRFPHEASLGPYLPIKRTPKTLIRLGGCPGWSESSLGAQSLCWFCRVAAHFNSFHLIPYQRSHFYHFLPFATHR